MMKLFSLATLFLMLLAVGTLAGCDLEVDTSGLGGNLSFVDSQDDDDADLDECDALFEEWDEVFESCLDDGGDEIECELEADEAIGYDEDGECFDDEDYDEDFDDEDYGYGDFDDEDFDDGDYDCDMDEDEDLLDEWLAAYDDCVEDGGDEYECEEVADDAVFGEMDDDEYDDWDDEDFDGEDFGDEDFEDEDGE